MDFANVFESLFDSLIFSLPLLGVYLWAWIRSRRLSDSVAWKGPRLRALLLALVLLLFAVPLVSHALMAWLPPRPPEGMMVYMLASASIRLLSNGVYAVCWFIVLRLVLDVPALSEPPERLEESRRPM